MNDMDDIRKDEIINSNGLSGDIISNISDMLVRLSEMTRTVVESFTPIINAMAELGRALSNAVPKEYLRGVAEVVQELCNNPNSFINYANYEEQLDNFHWAWPYNFTASELKLLIETVEDEKGFDDYMLKFFSSGKDSMLVDSILPKLPKRHQVIFKQIIKSYNQKNYAIANNALISIIDNLLAEYLINPGKVRRKGLFHPIVDFWSVMPYDTAITFRLMILSHNIDFIFEDYNFAQKIIIETNKKVRRHPAVHGFKYSNKKVDSLMLMNTLEEILLLKDVLKSFRRSLFINNQTKTFQISNDKVKIAFRPIAKKLIVDILKESENGLCHEQILKELELFTNNNAVLTSTYISGVLQSMKKQNEIYSTRENKKIKWVLKSTQE